jgi:uncharacterized protein (TIGR00255 family)
VRYRTKKAQQQESKKRISMLRSMTGYSQKEVFLGWAKMIIDLKSVNHRFFEATYHLPVGFSFLEEVVKEKLQKRIKRGKVNFSLAFSPAPKEHAKVRVELAKDYLKEMRNLGKILGITPKVDLETILHLPGIITLELDENAKRDVGVKAVQLAGAAVEDLILKKEKEGAEIQKDLLFMSSQAQDYLKAIAKELSSIIGKKKKSVKDQQKLADILNNIDIHEEIQRLGFHLANFKKIILKNGEEPRGKEMDFITQEMLREANTIGAKSVSKKVSFSVVKIKTHIEKMREQLQNVE